MVPAWKSACTATTLALFYALGATKFVDLDIWHSMSLAREVLRLGHFPSTDPFAYTPTVSPVVHHEWLWGFVLYLVAIHGGLIGLQGLRVALFAALALLCVRVARRRGATTASFVVAFPALVMSWVGLTAIRAQVVTLVFLALWLVFVEADRRGARWWIGPALVCHVLWLNLHAGFVVGIGVLALHALEQAIRRERAWHLGLVLAVMGLLVLVNPYGLAYPRYLGQALAMSRPLVTEWEPIWRAHPAALATYVLSVAIAAAALRSVGLREARGWPLLAVTAYLALRHQRHVSIYAIVWFTQVPALVARTAFGRTLDRMWTSPPGRGSIAVGLYGLLVAALLFGSRRPWELTVPAHLGSGLAIPYPVGPVEYLAALGFHGNVMTPFEVGAFVTWKLYPAVRVSFDGRYEAAYPPEMIDEEVAFYTAEPGWERVLDRYQTDVVLVRRRSPVTPLLTTRTSWRLVYQDDEYVMVARSNLPLALADRRGLPLIGSYP